MPNNVPICWLSSQPKSSKKQTLMSSCAVVKRFGNIDGDKVVYQVNSRGKNEDDNFGNAVYSQ